MSAPTVIVVTGRAGIVGAFESPDSLRAHAERVAVVMRGGQSRIAGEAKREQAKDLRAIADQADAAGTWGVTETGFRWKLCTVQ